MIDLLNVNDTKEIYAVELLADALKSRGYDGLYNISNGCDCDIDNLINCHDCDISECVCGYKVIPPKDIGDENDYYICFSPHDTPWEDKV